MKILLCALLGFSLALLCAAYPYPNFVTGNTTVHDPSERVRDICVG